jgi:hypothetical protein
MPVCTLQFLGQIVEPHVLENCNDVFGLNSFLLLLVLMVDNVMLHIVEE